MKDPLSQQQMGLLDLTTLNFEVSDHLSIAQKEISLYYFGFFKYKSVLSHIFLPW